MAKKLFRIATVPESLNILLKGQLRFFNDHYDVTAISSGGEELEELEQREGVKTCAIQMERPISPFKDLRSLYQLYRYFKKEKPDIIHSISPKAGLLSMLAGRFAGVPVRIHTFTGLIFPYRKGILKFILIWMDRLIAGCATQIYPEGKGVKEDLERYKITRKKLKVISNGNVNGIDFSHFDPEKFPENEKASLRESLGISENDFIFIFVGRIVKDKGINELVSAYKTISEKYFNKDENTCRCAEIKVGNPMNAAYFSANENNISYFSTADKYFNIPSSITGLKLRKRMGRMMYRNDGSKITTSPVASFQSDRSYTPYDPEHFSQFSTKIKPRVKLLLVGYMEQKLNPILDLTLSEIENNPDILTIGYVKDVRPYLALSNCLVLPSYREGFPNAVLQAGAMGLPSIVSDVNGCNEIIKHEKNGLIIPSKSHLELKSAMLRLVRDPILCKKLKYASRKMVAKKYAYQKIWDELRLEYEKCSLLKVKRNSFKVSKSFRLF